MILIFVNELAGPTGYHKSVVEMTNALSRAGHPVAVLSFLGEGDGAELALPGWSLDTQVPVFALQTLPADGGRMLHRNLHPVLTGTLGAIRYEFTANQLAALRQLNDSLTEDDTIIFTAPIPAYVFHYALGGETRRVKTVLQIHNDYHFHGGLWSLLLQSRRSIDRLQTVSTGLREQFMPTFADSDVVFVPNFPGASVGAVVPVAHEGVNIALPASFQHRKNQLDAVRALALIDDESVRLTLWGTISPLHPYYISVQQLVRELGLSHRVHFPGFGTETDIYSTADIVLMTSLSEGFGYPLIEAGYHGLPAVAYDFEFGPRDVIEEGASGYIVPLSDVAALANRLEELAADPAQRHRFGRRGREIFDERFSIDAVTAEYERFVGGPGAFIDLTELFATDGLEPIAVEEISQKRRRRRGRMVHEVAVDSSVPLYDVQVDDGERVESPALRREGTATLIEFGLGERTVVSYSTAPGSADRHYLVHSQGSEIEVYPYLRRDAGYASPSDADTIFAASGGAKRLTMREFQAFARATAHDIAWKIRQMSSRSDATPALVSSDSPPAPTAPEPVDAGSTDARARDREGSRADSVARTVGLPTARLGAMGRVGMDFSKRAAALAIQRLATKTPEPTRRQVARHPIFPVTSGTDSFGAPINQAGGVTVRNVGTPRRPMVTLRGEYDWVILRDASSERRVDPPFTYGEMFEQLCRAERDGGLFDIATGEGDYLWELGRSALVIQLAEAAGLWGAADALGAPVKDEYTGTKRLRTAPRARRVVFDYARRGQSGYRTAAFRDDETMFIVQPEADGYPEVDDTNMVYPFHEFTSWRQDWRRRMKHLRVPEIDRRPFEEALSEALGIRVDLGDHLRNRFAKFLAEREFWTPVFQRVRPEEVVIASSHWFPGIAAAATRAGAVVSDVQYALTSHYAPSFWFGGATHYGASRFYAWSEYWAARTNVYQEHVIVPRQQPEFSAGGVDAPDEFAWDVCVVSQPRVFRRILAFVQRLVAERPELRVVIAPHPSQRAIMAAEMAAAGLTGGVSIATEDTLATVRASAVCVGTFSTSLWEAAALGRPTYVIPVPGYEETLKDVESGLFRLATMPDDLVPFDVPESRRRIFGES